MPTSDPTFGLFKHRVELDLPDGDRELAAKQLAALGLVRIEEHRFVRCANSLDPDQRYLKDQYCDGRIYIERGLDEDDDDYHCPACGRVIRPSSKHASSSIRLTPDDAAMTAFIDQQIRAAGFVPVQRPRGIFRVAADDGQAEVCFVDLCAERAIFDDGYPVRAIFVVANDRDFAHRIPDDKETFRLAELVLGNAGRHFQTRLRELVNRRSRGVPALPAVLGLDAPLRPTTASAFATERHEAEDALFAWLHLSDLHMGHGDASHGWDQKLVLTELRQDIAAARSRGCPRPDAILVTGDITWSASPDQYKDARAWLSEVAYASGVDDDRIYAVPGNHDVEHTNADRDAAARDAARLVRILRDAGEPFDDALARDGRHLTTRLQPYLDFATTIAPECRDLFWIARPVARGGLRIRLVGLNTALLSAKDGDRGKLRLGNAQVAAALDKKEADELILVLSHHPFRGGWLADEKNADAWMRNHAHIHLFGHVKDLDFEDARSGAGGAFVRIAAGAAHCGQGEPAEHGYSIGAVVKTGNGVPAVRFWPRRWVDKQKQFRVDVANLPDGGACTELPLKRWPGGETR